MSHPQGLKPNYFLGPYRGPGGPLFHDNTLGGTAEAEPFHERFSTSIFDKHLSTGIFRQAALHDHLSTDHLSQIR